MKSATHPPYEKFSSLIPNAVMIALLMFLLPSVTWAISLRTFDSAGIPLYLSEEVKKNPDKFIEKLQENLWNGNLANIGVISKTLIILKPEDPVIKSIHAIFLASQNKIEEAEKILPSATVKKSFYANIAMAMIAQRQKKYAEALSFCDKAIFMDSSHPYPWNIKGRIYTEQGKNIQAITSFEKTIKLNPSFTPGYANLAAALYLSGDLNGAASNFAKAIKINPKNFYAHYGLALVYETAGKNEMALIEFNKALALKKESPEILNKIGELQIKTGHYQQAAATGYKMADLQIPSSHLILAEAALHTGHYQKALAFLDNVPAELINRYYVAGYCLMAMDRYDEAIEEMQNVLKKAHHFGAYSALTALQFYSGKKINAENIVVDNWDDNLTGLLYFFKGNIYAQAEKWPLASKNWYKAAGIISGFTCEGLTAENFAKGIRPAELRPLTLGLLYYFKNLNKLALLELDKALATNPESIWGNYWKAQILLQQENRSQAEVVMKKSLTHASNFYIALYGIGELSFHAGRDKEALEYYDRALQVKTDLGLLIKTGLLLEKTHQYSLAEQRYQEIIKFFPDLYLGYNQLAWFYASQSINLDKGLELAFIADKLQPGNAGINDTLAWLYYLKKEYETALKYVQKALINGYLNPTINFHAGMIQNSLGKKEDARKSLEKALSISNTFEGAAEAEKLLGN